MITSYKDPELFIKVLYAQLCKWKRSCLYATRELSKEYQVITPLNGVPALMFVSNNWLISRYKVVDKRGIRCYLAECNAIFKFKNNRCLGHLFNNNIKNGKLLNKVLLYPGCIIENPTRLSARNWVQLMGRLSAHLNYFESFFGEICIDKIPNKLYNRRMFFAKTTIFYKGSLQLNQDNINFIKDILNMEMKNA